MEAGFFDGNVMEKASPGLLEKKKTNNFGWEEVALVGAQQTQHN